MGRVIRILLQTTIPATADDWGVERFVALWLAPPAETAEEIRKMKVEETMTNAKQARAVAARALLGLFITALLLAPAATAARGQAAAQSKETFPQFWTRFKAALARDDRTAVAAMTKFRTGDATYMTDKEFLAKWYGELRRERRCFARAKPLKDQESYSVFCGERIFVFERIEGAWKFVDIGAND